ATMALRDLAEDRLSITLVAPEHDFELKALRTAEPFSRDHVPHYPLSDIAARFHAELPAGAVAAADPGRHFEPLPDGTDRAYAEIDRGRITTRPGQQRVEAERIVALPTLEGPGILGVPRDDHGFIPIDDRGRVRGLDDVYAAGDAVDFPVKQGGLACQQADAIAEHLAAQAGAPVEPLPFRPVLRGKLLTGRGS